MPSSLADAPRHAQHLAFVVEVQAVAGLDLQRGHAVVAQRARARQRLRQQFVLAGGAGVAHGRQDAAAGARDLLVVGALQALLEFAGAIAGEHRMGMAVDQPGRDAVAGDVDRLVRARAFAGSAARGPAKAMRPSRQPSAPSSTSP